MRGQRIDQFPIRLAPEERELIDRVAKAEDRTMAAVFRVALREYAQRRGLLEPATPQPERPAA